MDLRFLQEKAGGSKRAQMCKMRKACQEKGTGVLYCLQKCKGTAVRKRNQLVGAQASCQRIHLPF